MMRLSDAFKLAYTKLRVRKLRTVLSLLIASLLFSLLVTGSLIATGAFKSLDNFSNEGFSNRYIVSGIYQNYEGTASLMNDAALIVRAEELEKAEIAAKKAAAKKLNIEYDDKAATAAMESITIDPSGRKTLNTMGKFAQQAIAERQNTDPNKLSFEKFKNQVGQANAYYRAVSRDYMRTDLPKLALIKDGKEQVESNDTIGGYGDFSGQTGLQTVTNEWSLLDNTLLEPFVLPGQNLEIGSDGSLPIIASYSAAQEVLKLSKLPTNASSSDKKQRLETVRREIAGQTFEICYRNSTSSADYQMALQEQVAIKQNTGKAEYVKPDLIHKPSETPCQQPVIERDVRTAEAKLYQKHQDEFNQQFGKTLPESQIIKFRIVGVTQDVPSFSEGPIDLVGLVNSVVTSSVGARWVSPLSVKDNSVATKDTFKLSPVQLLGSQEAYFAEYSTPELAREVITTKTCRFGYGVPEETISSSIPVCAQDSPTSYYLNPFGSASLAIDDFKNVFHKFQLWAALIIGVIAAVILIGMIGRIIADARKETAVFRATGATRFMVAQIYLAYTLFLVVIMIGISLALGFGAAYWISGIISPDMSIDMALLFNVTDLSKQFTFYGLEPYDLLVISGSVLVASVVGASVPIASNIRRNPIRDMRDE